jgi:hypothetical protein
LRLEAVRRVEEPERCSHSAVTSGKSEETAHDAVLLHCPCWADLPCDPMVKGPRSRTGQVQPAPSPTSYKRQLATVFPLGPSALPGHEPY